MKKQRIEMKGTVVIRTSEGKEETEKKLRELFNKVNMGLGHGTVIDFEVRTVKKLLF